MIDIKAIKAAAEAIKGWGNCNQAWLATSDAESVAMVGAVCEEGVRYPVATIDCDQYYAGGDSLPLAKFYATANPATVIALCDEIERLKDCLKKANDQAEHFEREWYLRGDELDRLRSTINEFHHAIADAGWHPGRTDDLLTDIIRAKGVELAQLQEQNIYLDKVSSELQDLCDRQAKRLAE